MKNDQKQMFKVVLLWLYLCRCFFRLRQCCTQDFLNSIKSVSSLLTLIISLPINAHTLNPTLSKQDILPQFLHLDLPYSSTIAKKKKLQLRSRQDLLQEMHVLQEKVIWRAYTDSHLSLPSMFDWIPKLNAMIVQHPLRKSGLMVLGDSLSASRHFISCLYEHPSKDLKRWYSMIQTWHNRGDLSVFKRESFAAQHGATSWELLKSKRFKPKQGYGYSREVLGFTEVLSTPLLLELSYNSARYASLLIGTNDLLYNRGLERFSWRLIQLLETLKDYGVLPLIQTLPNQGYQHLKNAKMIQTFNRLIKVIASVEALPLLDLNEPLSNLNHQGLRADGIHLNAYSGGCKFSKKGLRFGQNLRNKLVLDSLFTLHQREKYILGKTQVSKPAKVLVSHINKSGSALSQQNLNSQTPCAQQIHNLSKRQRRWRLIRRGYQESKQEYHNVPIEAYGSWYIGQQQFTVSQANKTQLITLLSPGAKLDKTREQAWLKLNNGTCVDLKEIAIELYLPKGQHQFVHVVRSQPELVSQEDQIPTHQIQGRAVFAW